MAQELDQLRQECAEVQSLHEEAMARINELTVDAEIAHLEFEQVFDSVGDPTWVLNKEGEVLRINKAFQALLGLDSRKEALGRKCHDMLSCADFTSDQCPLVQVRQMKRVEMEMAVPLGTDAPIPFLVTAMPLIGLTGELIGVVEQLKNISERKRFEEALQKANAELHQLADVDSLTQLPNRRVFDERLDHEWRRMRREQQPLSLILCDIDFFKRYNDHYGHQAGDDCIRDVAACIGAAVRRPADLPARYGGEEFVAVLPNTTAEGAENIAQTIRRQVHALGKEHAQSDASDCVTLSLGVATVIPPQNGVAPEALLQAADAALYRAKETGRNRVTAADSIVPTPSGHPA